MNQWTNEPVNWLTKMNRVILKNDIVINNFKDTDEELWYFLHDIPEFKPISGVARVLIKELRTKEGLELWPKYKDG